MPRPLPALFTLALFVAVFPALTRAQSTEDLTARFEAYGGYYYVRFNVNANVQGVPPSQAFNANGGGVQLEYNATDRLGLVGDFAGYAVSNASNGALAAVAATYMFGPRLNFRRRRINPFAQALFGGIFGTHGIGNASNQNRFAMTAGGGIDFKLSAHLSLRPVQAEYVMTTFPDGLNNRQNNFRYGAGVVLRLGQR